MGDALDLARQAADQNRYRQAQKAAARQQAEDEMPGPTTYEGYDAGSARAIVRSLGNTPVQSGEVITNGGVKIGQRVDASSSPGRVAIDAMPRIRPQPERSTPQGIPQGKFVFFYQADKGSDRAVFIGGFKSRISAGSGRITEEIDVGIIQQNRRGQYVGGYKIFFSVDEPSQSGNAFVTFNDGKTETIEGDWKYAEARPIGYGLWLSTLDFVFFVTTAVSTFPDRQLTSWTAAQPYLSGSASSVATPDESHTSFSGQCPSILIDTTSGNVQTIGASFSGGIDFILPDYSSYGMQASGQTWILPGIHRPYSHTSGGAIGFANPVDEGYQTLFVDKSKTKAIALKFAGVYRTASKFVLFDGEDETELEDRPGFQVFLEAHERREPEVGETLTIARDGLIIAPPIRVGTNEFVENPLMQTVEGTPIVWSLRFEEGKPKCKKAFGRIVGAARGVGQIDSITIQIDRVVLADWDYWATYEGAIASDSGSVHDLLAQVFNGNLGNNYLEYGVALRRGGFPAFSPFGGGAKTLNYSWISNRIYVANLPPPYPTQQTDNWAEMWTIQGNKFTRQSRPVKAGRSPLLGEDETFNFLSANYHP